MEILHQVTFLQALLVAIFAGLAGIALFNVLTHIHRPSIACTAQGTPDDAKKPILSLIL